MTVNFVHLTDLHLSHPNINDPHLHTDTVENLRLMVARLHQMAPPPGFVVVSGDVTNQGDEASYQLVREILASVDVPIIYALGNHDKRAGFRSVFPEVAKDTTPDAPVYHHGVYNGVHVITLDTSVPGRVAGAICDVQFRFLALALKSNPSLPKLLVIHHPPFIAEESLVWECLSSDDTARLAMALQPHNFVGVLCGHIHTNRVSHWQGIPVIVANGLHAGVDALKNTGMQIEEGTGFGYCTLRPSGITVTFVPLTPKRRVLGKLSDDLVRSFR